MLINGLKYIIPCQSRFSRQTIDKRVEFEYERISTIIKNCLNNNAMSITDERAKQAFSELECVIYDLNSKPLTRRLRRRARREYKIVKRLQQFLRDRPDIIVCRIDKGPGFYIGKTATIASKAQEYITKTNAYEEITSGRCPLADNINAVTKLLNHLLQQQTITKEQFNKLSSKSASFELAHFHALPKVHKPETPIRPIVAGIHAPATLLSKFLNHLLAPIYLQVTKDTTFINSIHVIRKLEKYAAGGNFKSTTYFITADVKNLYTMIPRNGALHALIRFLEKYSHKRKIGTFRIDHIMRMARLILDTNSFVYDNKYYRQVQGGAMGSAFTQVLANIYMLEWEHDLIEYQDKHEGIYGRYIDDIFMVTNEPLDKIKQELDKAQTKDVHIEIETTINTSVNYLDVTIANDNGRLKTTIYHKPTADLCYLPYTSDHPHRYHRNIPYTAILRAARICSNVHDFNQERLRIGTSLLLSNYPSEIISNQFHRFFQVNDADLVFKQLDEQVYKCLHNKLLHHPTPREKKLNHSLQHHVQYPMVLQQKPWDKKLIYPIYTFQSGPTTKFSHEFYHWWHKHYCYPESSVKNVKLRLLPKTNSTLETFLIHKKPSHEILTKMEATDN